MVVAYIWFTFAITRWRIQFRRDMNQSDTDANTKAVDSLLNYETVKYFNNERHETRRFDKSMEKYAKASIQTQISLSVLNTGQALIMALGLAAVMALAADRHHATASFTVGDFVMANCYLDRSFMCRSICWARSIAKSRRRWWTWTPCSACCISRRK